MAELRIGQVAERSGLAPSAIRYYESEGLVPRPARRNGRRVYDVVAATQVLGEAAEIARPLAMRQVAGHPQISDSLSAAHPRPQKL